METKLDLMTGVVDAPKGAAKGTQTSSLPKPRRCRVNGRACQTADGPFGSGAVPGADFGVPVAQPAVADDDPAADSSDLRPWSWRLAIRALTRTFEMRLATAGSWPRVASLPGLSWALSFSVSGPSTF